MTGTLITLIIWFVFGSVLKTLVQEASGYKRAIVLLAAAPVIVLDYGLSFIPKLAEKPKIAAFVNWFKS